MPDLAFQPDVAKVDLTIDPQLDARAIDIGRDIFSRVKKFSTQGMSGAAWKGRMEELFMQLGMRDPVLKAQLFRFVDVLPALKTPTQVNSHLREYLQAAGRHLPLPLRQFLRWIPADGVLARPLAEVIRLNARKMARRFIAAGGVDQAVSRVIEMRGEHLAFTMDVLGEAVVSEAEADRHARVYVDLLEGLAAKLRATPNDAQIDEDHLGRPVPRVNVSVKLSSLFSQFDPIDPRLTSGAVLERLRPILRRARQLSAFVNFDIEQYAVKDTTLAIFQRVFDEPEFRDWADVGLAIQAYLKETAEDLRGLRAWAAARGTPVTVRLVKGAYWDYETVVAAQQGWEPPVFLSKPESDANFERCGAFLVEHHEHLKPAIASHNVRSIAAVLAAAERAALPVRGIEFQMLYGMALPIRSALVEMGHRVRVYTPFGQLLPGMAYLVRRLLENTSNESFLRAGFVDRVPEEQLLMNPIKTLREKGGHRLSHLFDHRREETGGTLPPFRNEPLSDFSRPDARAAMLRGLEEVKQILGRSFPLVIGGRDVETPGRFESINPWRRTQKAGHVHCATVAHAREAVAVARRAFDSWREESPARRAELLLRVAEIMRRRRFELAAIEIYESAKPWRDADGDVAEAIDFCEFYAREMLRLAKPQRRDVPGEANETIYEGRGVCVVLAPWNFPLAILTGMTAAAVVAGNTVIMKPAEQAPVIAAYLQDMFEEAGAPPGVVNFLPGVGDDIGPELVNHPDVSIVTFTGSRSVGVSINASAAATPPGQSHVKRVIAEMGGKNAVIVDDDADLDEAIAGVVASAFGYAGQKCSACSRVIVLESVHDAFVARLIEATRSLRVGPADDPATVVPPVIDAEARDRIKAFVEQARGEATLAYAADVTAIEPEGFFVGPHIFTDVSPDSSLAQQEIFGPVLAVMKARDLTQAIRMANGTLYALTGGIYSRSPANIERARREFRVGNLYINRRITGALVDRQPFGGHKLSGTGPKAGGSDYLLQFLLARTITENTLRHGFATE